jgi:hypothetical protein
MLRVSAPNHRTKEYAIAYVYTNNVTQVNNISEALMVKIKSKRDRPLEIQGNLALEELRPQQLPPQTVLQNPQHDRETRLDIEQSRVESPEERLRRGVDCEVAKHQGYWCTGLAELVNDLEECSCGQCDMLA